MHHFPSLGIARFLFLERFVLGDQVPERNA